MIIIIIIIIIIIVIIIIITTTSSLKIIIIITITLNKLVYFGSPILVNWYLKYPTYGCAGYLSRNFG